MPLCCALSSLSQLVWGTFRAFQSTLLACRHRPARPPLPTKHSTGSCSNTTQHDRSTQPYGESILVPFRFFPLLLLLLLVAVALAKRNIIKQRLARCRQAILFFLSLAVRLWNHQGSPLFAFTLLLLLFLSSVCVCVSIIHYMRRSFRRRWLDTDSVAVGMNYSVAPTTAITKLASAFSCCMFMSSGFSPLIPKVPAAAVIQQQIDFTRLTPWDTSESLLSLSFSPLSFAWCVVTFTQSTSFLVLMHFFCKW